MFIVEEHSGEVVVIEKGTSGVEPMEEGSLRNRLR
jgi:hypothetical protein